MLTIRRPYPHEHEVGTIDGKVDLYVTAREGQVFVPASGPLTPEQAEQLIEAIRLGILISKGQLIVEG